MGRSNETVVLLPRIVITFLNSDFPVQGKVLFWFLGRWEHKYMTKQFSRGMSAIRRSDLANPGRMVVRELGFLLQVKGTTYCCSSRTSSGK